MHTGGNEIVQETVDRRETCIQYTAYTHTYSHITLTLLTHYSQFCLSCLSDWFIYTIEMTTVYSTTYAVLFIYINLDRERYFNYT